MDGLPVTIRLLDPPLHEFLPDREAVVEHLAEAPVRGNGDVDELEHVLERMRALDEGNPMLGTRGVRLGLLHPEIYEMQARAIFRAVRAVAARGGDARNVEVMIPLIAYTRELQRARELVERVAAEEGCEGARIGTMIELPRACLRAGEIARGADFFSLGTNDLIQTGLGFSRDDAGVCGEHGGDPRSIGCFHAAGLDYVSCSPFRVPVARVAAAHAAIVGGELRA